MTNRAKSDEEIAALSDEDLLDGFAMECECESRRISTDPDDQQAYFDELLRRLKRSTFHRQKGV